MEFKRIGAFSRTPEGYRLATLEEVKNNRENLRRRGILDKSSDALVLNGVARDVTDLMSAGRHFQVFYVKIPVSSFPGTMIVYGQTPTHVRRIPGLLRKELYSQIFLDDEERKIAFSLAFLNQDIEVIHWLRHSATSSQLDELKTEYAKYKDDADGFSKIVKWLLYENEDIKENEVQEALDCALRDTGRTDLAMAANHAIAIVEIILAICSGKQKVDLVYSQIDRVAKSSGKTHTAVLAKLLSECAVHKQLEESWNAIILSHFEELFKEAVGRGYIPLVKHLLKIEHNGEGKFKYLVNLPHPTENKLVRGVDNEGKTLLHYAAEWEGGESESSEPDNDVDAVSTSLFLPYEDEFARKVDNRGRSILHFASFGGRDKFCEFLFDRYDFENVVDDCGQNFLHYAAQGKNGSRIVDRLNKKLLRGSDSGLVSCINNKGETPLHQAAMYGKADMINSMMLWCQPILTTTLKQTDSGGRTPLHLAARHGHINSVTELLNAGSDPLEDRDISGKTALHHVVANPNLKTEDAKALIDVLVDHYEGKKGKRALFLWASAIGIGTADETEGLPRNLVEILNRKKDSAADINLLNEAASQKNSRMTWELLNRGGDIAQLQTRDFLWVRNQVEKFSTQATDRFTIVDTLGRNVLAECIAAHFLNPYIKAPITVGIAGGSGMGKTSLMNMIEAELLVTAAQLAFPDAWQYDSFNGAKKIVLSKKGKRMCNKIEEEVANLFTRRNDREYAEMVRDLRPRHDDKEALLYFFLKYRPEYKAVYKYLARMDFNQLLEKNEEDSVNEDEGQSLGAIPRILTVNFNAGNYRGRQEAWARLALEITKEIEASMTLAQWLSTCWRNAWRSNSQSYYMQFIFPCLLFAFLALWIASAAWMFLDRAKDPQLKKLKYGSIPATVLVTIWLALRGVISIFKPVSKQLSSYFSLPDHSQQLGYQEKVISDIKFLKEETGKEPHTIFSLIAGEKCKYWGGLWENKVDGTHVPKYGSAPDSKLRIIAFVDDLDHCEDEVILRVLWAINLVFRVCEISVILAMDKTTVQTAFKNSSQNHDEDYVDKFISKTIQLPVSLPDPADVEWSKFLQQELRLSERDLSESGVIDEDRPRANSKQDASANEDEVNTTVQRTNDVESGCTTYEGGNPSSNELLIQIQKALTSWFGMILSWTRRKESEPYQPSAYEFKWHNLAKRIWQLRKIVMQGYSEDEIQTLEKLKGFTTGIQKLPREWRCYINYYKFARNVIVKKAKNAGEYPYRTVEFVAWTFVCWQWKHEMNILIKDWHSYTDVKDKEGHIKRKPSLKEIVANYIKRRWSLQAQAEQTDCNKEEEKKKEWMRLKEALDTIKDISMEGLCGSKEYQFQCEIGKLLDGVPRIGWGTPHWNFHVNRRGEKEKRKRTMV